MSVRFSNWLLDENNGDTRAYRLEMDMMAVNPEYREHRINEFLSKNYESLLDDNVPVMLNRCNSLINLV